MFCQYCSYALSTGCPFVCSVSDTSRVSVNLSSLELIPVNQVARFHMTVDSSGSAELAVAITGPSCELPVKVSLTTKPVELCADSILN